MRRRSTRAGFTLVELLVVMALMAMLAALAIRFLPSASASARESRAGMSVQGWLNIAKQRALRDQMPRGLRFFLSPVPVANAAAGVTVPGIVEAQYLETPEDYSPSLSTIGRVPPAIGAGLLPPYNPSNTLYVQGADMLNGYSNAPANQAYWSVQPGDILELTGTGLIFRITSVDDPSSGVTLPPGPPYNHIVGVQPPVPPWVLANPGQPTANYRIMRRPRPVGEEMLKMPAGTMIDPGASAFALGGPGLPVGTTYVDVLYSPNGSVMMVGIDTASMPATGLNGKIHLYVRAPDANDGAAPPGSDPFHGDPTLISTYVRTGFVGAYPPARPPYTPPFDMYSLVP